MRLFMLLASAPLLGEVGTPAPRTTHDVRPSVAREAWTPHLNPQSTARSGRARNDDQTVLRAMADQLAIERTVVHAMMTEPASHAAHGTAMDPAAWDGEFDMQQREAVAMLDHDHGQVVSPAAPAPAPEVRDAAAAPGHPAAGGMDGMEEDMTSLLTQWRKTVALSNAAMPRLRRASTRGFARRVRDSHIALIRQLGSPSAH